MIPENQEVRWSPGTFPPYQLINQRGGPSAFYYLERLLSGQVEDLGFSCFVLYMTVCGARQLAEQMAEEEKS